MIYAKKDGFNLALIRNSVIILAILVCCFGCDEAPLPPLVKSPAIFVLGYDLSGSFKGYRKLDEAFLDSLCVVAANTGGFVVVYGIGNPTESTGIRCSFDASPQMDESLVLSEQVELRTKMSNVAQKNDKARQSFIQRVNKDILNDPKLIRQTDTDINGFFDKAGLLIAEPEYRSMRKFVFVYSDGIQSIGGVDTPAHCGWSAAPGVTLCLAGWKTLMPSDKINIKRFEDPNGFIAYLHTL